MESNSYHSKWCRRILNYLWIISLLSVIVPIINSFFTETDFVFFLKFRIVLPALIQFSIIIIMELYYRSCGRWKNGTMITGSFFLMGNVLYFHQQAGVILLTLLIFPLFIAIMTLEKKLIYSTFLGIFLTLMLIVYAFESMNLDAIEFITFTSILIASLFLSIELLNRYMEVFENLKQSVAREKELFFQNVYMEKMSKVDLPTNLYNHKTFYEYLDELITSYEKEPFNLHLALLDLDHFKSVNDNYGHATGDVVIKYTADLILSEISSNDFAARYGGEEFAILFTEKSSQECYTILESIRSQLEKASFEEMNGKTTSLSIGFTSVENFPHRAAFFERADQLLYEAKKTGRNKIMSDV